MWAPRCGHWRCQNATIAAWPLAIMHSVGTGTDGGTAWGLLLVGGCVLAVVACLAWRVAATRVARAEIEGALPARGTYS